MKMKSLGVGLFTLLSSPAFSILAHAECYQTNCHYFEECTLWDDHHATCSQRTSSQKCDTVCHDERRGCKEVCVDTNCHEETNCTLSNDDGSVCSQRTTQTVCSKQCYNDCG